MATRTSYDDGTPCWVDLSSPDVDQSVAFYHSLFGWDPEEAFDDDGTRIYVNFFKGGERVAGVGGQQPGMDGVPALWSSYVAVSDSDAVAAKAAAAGGTVILPPMDVMDEGRMMVLADPSGAVIGTWQAGNHIGASRVNEPDTWSWNELMSRDLPAAQAFYTETFGWTYTPMEMPAGTYHVIDGGPEGIGGMMDMPDDIPEQVPNHWAVYFNVASTDDTVAAATKAGGTLSWGPDDLPVGRMAGLVDPLGGAFSVMQPPADHGA